MKKNSFVSFVLLMIFFATFGWSANVNLTLTFTDSPDPVNTNGLITYTVKVANNNLNNAKNVNVTVPLPGGTTYVSGDTGCSLSGTNVVCNFDSISKNTSETLAFKIQAPSSATTVSATATVSTTDSNQNTTISKLTTTTVQASYTCANPRQFKIANTVNIKGNMRIIGNTNLCYKHPTTGQCADPGDLRNNNIDMIDINTDNDDSTFNHSSATISLGTGSTVKWAKLYWQGYLYAENDTVKNSSKSVKFKTPVSTYQTINSATADYNYNWVYVDSSRYYYQGSADVTALVKAAGTGTYTTANIKTELGKPTAGSYGGWALVIVYENANESFKNITVYDGYLGVSSDTDAASASTYATNNQCSTLNTGTQNNTTVTLSGFLTPTSGTIKSSLVVFAGEGDKGTDTSATQDYFKFDSTNISNTLNPINDIFNSTITYNNQYVTNTTTPISRTPYYSNNSNGIDIDTFDVSSLMSNSKSSVTLQLGTYGEIYFPGVFGFSTDIYTPDLCYVENIFRGTENISGTNVQVKTDENLTVRVYLQNTGIEPASKVQLQHQFDSTFPYDENTTDYNNSNPAYSTVMPPPYVRKMATDKSSDDIFEYNSTSLLAKINLGKDANVSSGGTFLGSKGTTAVFEYNATVKSTATYSNTYKVAYKSLDVDYSNAPVTISSCDGSTNSFFGYSFTTQGSIDTVDNYANNGYTAAMGLQTKIANKPNYTLDALWLSTGSTPTAYTGTNYDMLVLFRLSDSTCTDDKALSSSDVTATFAHGTSQSSATSNSFQMLNQANKNAKIKAHYIDWNSMTLSLINNSCTSNSSITGNLKGVPQCVNGNESKLINLTSIDISECVTAQGTYAAACDSNAYTASGSKGNIYPEKYNNAYGCLMCLSDKINTTNNCSTDNFAIRPNDFNSTITAKQKFIADKNSSITFRANQYSGTGTKDYNETVNTSFKVDVNISDSTKTCTAPSIQFTPTIVFVDGNVTGNYSLPNVGDFNLTIYEKSGSEFALVDADDTPDSQRYISTYTQQIKVIPKSFNLDGNFTNGGNGFSYLSDFETYPNASDRNVSAVLDLNISARSDTNATLSNYTSLCYAKDANITMNTTTSGNTLTGLSKLLWYDKLHDLNGSISLTSASNYKMKLDNTQFDSTETNGTAQVNYLINFNRNSTNAVQPFIFNVSDVNTSDEDNVTGTKAFTNQRATYYYGRAFAPDQTYIGKSGTATIYYEVYCNGCSATTRTTFGIDGNESVQAINWYQNTDHNSSAGVVTPKPQQFAKFSSYPVTNSTTASISTETLTLLGTTNLPFTDKVDLNSDNWLVYYPTYYAVNFKSSGNWAGEGRVQESSSATNKVGATVDSNMSNSRTNKRLDW
jgi:hypothetical protein